MNNVSLIAYLKDVISPFNLITHDGKVVMSYVNNKEKNVMLLNKNLQEQTMSLILNQDTPVLLSPSNNIAGMVFANGEYLIIGPVNYDNLNFNTLRDKITAINSLLNTYFYADRNFSNEHIQLDNTAVTEFINNIEKQKLLHNENLDIYSVMPTDIPHNSYSYERKHLEAVTEGNPEKAIRALRSPMHGKEGKMGFTPLRHAKNSVIINATLDARAAIRGGVRVETAYTLADFFILAAELCKTENEAVALREECTYRFAMLVQSSKHKEVTKYCLIVNKVLEEIERSLFVKVTRDDLVKCVERNIDYVQRLFKQDLGHSIMEHLRMKRIDAAKEILSTSNVKISDLATLLHFSSTSHFARVFRQFTGVSPVEYKEQSHKKVLL